MTDPGVVAARLGSREDAWTYITQKIDECRVGASDAEARCLALAEEHDFDKGGISEAFGKARLARTSVEARDKKFCREIQPRVALVEPKAVAALGEQGGMAEPRVEEGKPKPDPEATPGPETEKAPSPEPVILNPAAPLDTAREFAARHVRTNDLTVLWFWQDQFWRWNGTHYVAMNELAVRGKVYLFLDQSRKVVGGNPVPFQPRPRQVDDVIDCLKSALALEPECAPPMWMEDRRPATDWVVFRNGVVNVITGERRALTPDFWAHGMLDFDWDPAATCPTWDRFLEGVFEDDPQSQTFLEEWMGYCMTEETKFQKGALLVGPKRSGKSTISHVLRHLISDRAYVGLSFSSWVANDYSKECLIGKRVGVFSDVRFKPGRAYGRSYDPGGITHNSAELLLNITGEDVVTIGRKYRAPWHGQLRLKIMLISNEVPNLNDSGGTLPSRFVKLKFTKSFWGKEDPELRGKLLAELPGIAARCVRAYQQLCTRGRFVQPEAGLGLDREVEAASDPWIAMLGECFVVEADARIDKSVAYSRFCQWCEEAGRRDMQLSTTSARFTQRLRALVPGLNEYRQHSRPRQYVGIRLKRSDPSEPP